MVNQLLAAGYRASQIVDILIGSQWTGVSNDQQVVDLQPTYYVEMKGEYRDYQSWLNHVVDASANAAVGQTATPSNDDVVASESEPTQSRILVSLTSSSTAC